MKPQLSTSTAIAFGLFAATTGVSHAATDVNSLVPPLKGSLLLKSMPLSPIVNRKITTWTYLPPGYATSSQRYPVIYLLSGQPGGWTDCFLSGHVEEMADKLIDSGQMKPAILVAFDGNGEGGSRDVTNFCNRATDNYRAEDFIANELVPYIDTNLRTIPDATHRALWGYSGGGFGALNIGIHHPDEWKIWASHAGFYEAGDDDKVMTKILGPKAQNQQLWQLNSPVETIKTLTDAKDLHVYMDASPKEEDFDGFQTMTQELNARGADVDAVSRPKAHAWKVITQNCKDSLLFINRNWG